MAFEIQVVAFVHYINMCFGGWVKKFGIFASEPQASPEQFGQELECLQESFMVFAQFFYANLNWVNDNGRFNYPYARGEDMRSFGDKPPS